MQIQDILSNPDYQQKIVLQKLLCHYLDLSREDLRIHSNQEIPNPVLEKVITGYKQYVDEKMPLEYILGFVEFFNTKFIVNEATLIPRPETEYMIQAVTEYITKPYGEGGTGRFKKEKTNPSYLPTAKDGTSLSGEQNIINHGNNILLDIGTGCGVLGISVLLQNPDFFSKSIFTDFYANAIEVAKQNYKHLIINPETETDFIQSDLLDFIQNLNFDIKDFNIILVANLPYIPEKTFDDNSPDNVQKREPKPAFVGGEDGLIYYYKMLDQILEFSKTGGHLTGGHLTMFLEMMTRQIDILRQKYSDYFIFEEVKTFHFNIRILKVTCK